MMTTSAFEILGPIMVGPSSSHTAGALRIALVARSLGPSPLARVTSHTFAHLFPALATHGREVLAQEAASKCPPVALIGLTVDVTKVELTEIRVHLCLDIPPRKQHLRRLMRAI